MRFLRYWNNPDFWRWQWQRISFGAKLFVVVGLAVAIGLGGYIAAQGLAAAIDDPAAFAPPRQEVVTVQETVVRRAGGETVVKSVTLPGPTASRGITDSQTQTVLRGKPWYAPSRSPRPSPLPSRR